MTITITPVRWSWTLVIKSNGSCLPQIHFKSWWCHRYFDSMTSSSFFCVPTPKTPNFSNFHRIKLIFGLGVDFGTLISSFNSKIELNVKIWQKRASFLWFRSSTVSKDGHHDNKETSILKLLVLKDSLMYLCMIKVTKFGEDWLNGFWIIKEKPGDGPICPPPPPLQIELKCIIICSSFLNCGWLLIEKYSDSTAHRNSWYQWISLQ